MHLRITDSAGFMLRCTADCVTSSPGFRHLPGFLFDIRGETYSS
jgi:hypothetical protein